MKTRSEREIEMWGFLLRWFSMVFVVWLLGYLFIDILLEGL